MSKKTKIEWCDSTANPVIGCTKVSAGCLNCYAAVDTPARVLRAQGTETWGANAERVAVKGFEKSMLAMNRRPWVCDKCGTACRTNKTGHTKLTEVGLVPCLCTSYHRRRVFVGSQCDLFDPAWKVETLAHTFDVIRCCPDIEVIICTKRPELWKERMVGIVELVPDVFIAKWLGGNAPANITLLTSVENQAMADKRIPELLRIPAARRGLSMEPLLGPVDLSEWLHCGECGDSGEAWDDSVCPECKGEKKLDWLIVGGESGHGARPCNVDWIRGVVRQGQAAGVPVFVKQWGSKPEGLLEPFGEDREMSDAYLKHPKGGDPSEWPEDLRVQQWPKGGV